MLFGTLVKLKNLKKQEKLLMTVLHILLIMFTSKYKAAKRQAEILRYVE